MAQRITHAEVFESIRYGRSLPVHHSLSKFDISLGTDQLIRISGRVREPDFPLSSRSLILLSLNYTLTKLFLSTPHITYKHAGISALMSVILETYYISGLRNFLKLISRRCPMCQKKAYSRPLNQRMGMLPLSRTTPAPPFERTGMDFAGPFYIRQGKVRKPTRVKCYASLFICLTTKAVHIELCADLTTEEFMAAFHRFTARRGTPSTLFL